MVRFRFLEESCDYKHKKAELVLVFRMKEQIYCIHARNCKKVIEKPEIIDMPAIEKNVIGGMDFNGDIIKIVDFNQLIGGVESEWTEDSKVIIIKRKSGFIGWRVDDVVNTENIFPEDVKTIESPSEGEFLICLDGLVYLKNNIKAVLVNI